MHESNIVKLDKTQEDIFYKKIVSGAVKRVQKPINVVASAENSEESSDDFVTIDTTNDEYCIVKRRTVDDKVYLFYDYWK